MPSKEIIWIEDNRVRLEKFRAALRTGDSEEWVKLIKTLYLKKQERTKLVKKLWNAGEDIMKVAEKNLYEEFAIVLNIHRMKLIPIFLTGSFSNTRPTRERGY